MKRKLYKVTIDPDNIYDGDTIEHVRVLIYPMDSAVGHTQPKLDMELWPNIYLTDSGIETRFSLRLEGIDTPEMHPHHMRDGKARTQESLDHEKQLAQKARQGLIDYLKQYNYECWLSDYQDGKYAGRIVANLYVKDENKKLRSVSNYMISKGFARQYFGKTKQGWDNWN